jgi:hypothetical protein
MTTMTSDLFRSTATAFAAFLCSTLYLIAATSFTAHPLI